jgi:hypothetical protein
MGFTIGILEVGQLYRDEEAEEFADTIGVSDSQGKAKVFNMVKLAGTLYVREKYHCKIRDLAGDLAKVKADRIAISTSIQEKRGFSDEIQDDLDYIAALERKNEALGPIYRKDEMTAQFGIKNMFGESILFVPSSPKKTGKQSLYFVNDIGEILDTSINQTQVDIDHLERIHTRLSKLERKYVLILEGSKSRSGAEFFAIDVLVTFYEDITGKKGGRSNRPDKSGPDGRLLEFVEKVLVRLRPPASRHRRLDYALRRVIKFREIYQENIAKLSSNAYGH